MGKRKWTVYFEIFGKKMKTQVEADSNFEVKAVVKEKIIFHKIEDNGPVSNYSFNDLFDFFKKKPH